MLTKTVGEDLLPWTWWEQALVCCLLEASLLVASGFAGSAQFLPAPGVTLPGLWAAQPRLGSSKTLIHNELLVNFPFHREN